MRLEFLNAGKDRYFTAAILAIVVGVILLINNFFLTWLFLGIVYLVGFSEANKLFGIRSASSYLMAASIWGLAYFYPDPEDIVFLFLIIAASKIAFKNAIGQEVFAENSDLKSMLPILYPTLPMLFMLALFKDYGIVTLVWLIVVVAVCDTGAYFTGRAIGRIPFSPDIPKKTFEGVVGGIIIETIVGTLMGLAFLTLFKALFVSFFVALASIFGDLFESSLKRNAGVKDSGSILPGHGGVLDRLDGHLFGAVIMTLILRWVY